jgi:hypothetical protein
MSLAEVMYNADSEFGARTVTVDVTNGLEFLDLTMTIDISYDDMVSTHLASGGQYDGWRHATSGEYFALVASAGIVFNGSDPSPSGNVSSLIHSLGETFDSFGDGQLAQGITGTANGTSRHLAYSIGFFRNFKTDEFEPVSKSHNVLDNVASSEHGHFLVRPVPAPSSSAILAMTGILATRRRR